MKKIIATATLILLGLSFSFTAAQKTETRAPVKRVVTSRAIKGQPAGKPYVLDLSRKGTIYTVDADVDYSRLRVRTSKGETSMQDVLTKSGARGRLLVGTPSDMVSGGLKTLNMTSRALSRGSGNRFIGCDGAICICTGDDDCNKMLSPGGDCPEGSHVVCWGSGASAACVCVR
jgi:hypothetical protein